ncbi:MAG: DUF1850 domain-containing protein [Rectinemataceae bacterium]
MDASPSRDGLPEVPAPVPSRGKGRQPCTHFILAALGAAFVALAAFAILTTQVPALRISDGKGVTLAVLALPEGTFIHHYTHSIHLSAVDEYFRIEDGQLRLYELRYDTNSVGMPSDTELGFRIEDKRYVLSMDRRFGRIPIRVADLGGHGVIIGGTFHPFSALMRPQGQLVLSGTKVLAARFWR